MEAVLRPRGACGVGIESEVEKLVCATRLKEGADGGTASEGHGNWRAEDSEDG